jgi:mannosyltransferase
MKRPGITDINSIYIVLILILGAILRLYGLTNQSLWVDELHTMNEADPDIAWGLLFDYLKCCDQHPPLYFIIQRLSFSAFGHTELVARLFSALCGITSIWAIYLLGKELLNQRLGILASLLMCVNFFNVDYSQEARGYILALLMSVFSYLYFVKTIRNFQRKDSFLYALFSLLLLYTHYYSLFVVASQGLVVLILFFGQKEERPKIIKMFGVAGLIILIGYSPWIPFMLAMSKMNTFWIREVPDDFAITYFYDYFGNYPPLSPFLILLLTFFLLQVMNQKNLTLDKIKESPILLTFLVFFCGVVITYFIPYLRSVTVVPMLFNRYTIVILPAFIIVIAFSFLLISNRLTQYLLIVTFIVLSLTDLLIVKKYYSKRSRKTQFREMTQYISSDPKYIYPIVEDRAAWQHRYYLKRYNYQAPLLSGNKTSTLDSIMNRTSRQYDLEGFWVVGAHADDPHLEPLLRTRLDSVFTLIKEAEFFDAWAQLYVRKDIKKDK